MRSMTILMTMMTLKVLVLTISGETSGEMSRHDGTHTWGLGLWVNSAILVHGKNGGPNGYRTILMYSTHPRRPSRHCSSSMGGRLLEPTMSGSKWSSLSWFTVALPLSVNTLWVWCCSWGGGWWWWWWIVLFLFAFFLMVWNSHFDITRSDSNVVIKLSLLSYIKAASWLLCSGHFEPSILLLHFLICTSFYFSIRSVTGYCFHLTIGSLTS